MKASMMSYFEAGASPKTVQNLLCVRYKHDPATFLQIPGYPVLRNFLRNLRRKDIVLAHDVAMAGPGPRRPASNLPDADVSGVPLGSPDEPLLELGANKVVGELVAFSEAHDFKSGCQHGTSLCHP